MQESTAKKSRVKKVDHLGVIEPSDRLTVSPRGFSTLNVGDAFLSLDPIVKVLRPDDDDPTRDRRLTTSEAIKQSRQR